MQIVDDRRGSTSVEASGIAVVVALAMALLATAFPQAGQRVADAVETPVRRAVGGAVEHRVQLAGSSAVVEPAPSATARGLARGAVREFSVHAAGSAGGGDARASLTGCLVCAGAHARIGGGPQRHTRPRSDEIGGSGFGGAAGFWAALARMDAGASFSWEHPLARASWDGGVNALAGLVAESQAQIGVVDGAPRAAAALDAAVGGRVRAEHTAAAELAGIAVRHAAGAEAWAGIGVTAAGHATMGAGKIGFGGRFGAAFGVGGAVDASVELDLRAAAANPAVQQALVMKLPGLALGLHALNMIDGGSRWK